MASQPVLSLCMIVRDEQELLPRCLRSARPWVDEMVVVDTGSTDGTIAIARENGASVHEVAWNDDFAAARNAAIDRAQGRFVLFLDADEWLEQGPWPAKLRRSLKKSKEEAMTLIVRDRLDRGEERRYPLVRLFRNRPEYRYEGIIHEQITPAISRRAGGARIRPPASGFKIGHDGYRTDRSIERKKVERNLELLERQVRSRPRDASTRYFLLRELVPMRGGRAVPGDHLAQAVPHCDALLELYRELPESLAVDSIRLCAALRIATGRHREAAELLEDHRAADPAIAILAADVDLVLAGEDPRRAGEAARRLLECADRADGSVLPFHDPSLSRGIVCARAAEALARSGEIEQARRLAREAVTAQRATASAWNALAAVERAAGNPDAALRAYREAVRTDPQDPWTWVGLGETLLELGAAVEATSPLRRAATLAPGWDRPQRALARAQAAAPERVSTS